MVGNTKTRIVVGVDSSESSLAALRWALGQAEATGATVEAVQAWHIPFGYGSVPAVLPDEDLAAAAQSALEASVAEATAEHPTVAVDMTVRRGHPAEVLLERAAAADLLVVGSRGHGGVVGALLGSVSQYCVHHGQCPVVVVRT